MRTVAIAYHPKLCILARAAVVGTAIVIGTLGAALAQQSALTGAATGAQGASQTGAVTDFQDQLLYRLISPGPDGNSPVFGFEFPTARLRETWHDSYPSPQDGPTYKSFTKEESLIGSAYFKVPYNVLGGTVQFGTFLGVDELNSSYKRSSGPGAYDIVPGTRTFNHSYLAGGYALYSSGSNYALNTVTIFEGRTDEKGGVDTPGTSHYNTHGFVNSTVAGHVFNLEGMSEPLKLDIRAGLLYSNAHGDAFADPAEQILRPSTQEWTGSLSAMLFEEWVRSGGETLRPYVRVGVKQQFAYSDQEDLNWGAGIVNTYHFGQSGTLGFGEAGFDYAFSNVTLTGALYGEKSADQATIGGRLGAKFTTDSLGHSGSIPAASWTGFYAGANGGYGWSAASSTISGAAHDSGGLLDPLDVSTAWAAPTWNFDRTGGFAGGQVGYNLQRDRIVYGVEADLQRAGVNGASTTLASDDLWDVIATAHHSSTLNWLGTLRGRLGYTYDRALIYFTGGFAFGGTKDRLSLTMDDTSENLDWGTGNGTISQSSARKDAVSTGYVLGGGLEYAIFPAWSLKGEYQYIDLGRSVLRTSVYDTVDGGNSALASTTIDHTYHSVRLGLNYHIPDGDAPLK